MLSGRKHITPDGRTVGYRIVEGRQVRLPGIEMLSSALAAALQTSRDAARAAGTQPIPPHIHEALFAYYPPELLAGIEYRVGVTEEATLQAYSIRYGDATAVTTIAAEPVREPCVAVITASTSRPSERHLAAGTSAVMSSETAKWP